MKMTNDTFSGPVAANNPCSSVFDRIELSSSTQPGMSVSLTPVAFRSGGFSNAVPLADAIRQALLDGVAALDVLESDSPADSCEVEENSSCVGLERHAHSDPVDAHLPTELVHIPAMIHKPFIIVGKGQDRAAFGRTGLLDAPGVYVLLSGQEAYVGSSRNVSRRISAGHQHSAIDMIVSITDEHGEMTRDDAKTVERLLWSQMHWSGEYILINGECPDGAAVTVDDFERLRMFVAEAVLALRQVGALFTVGCTRRQITGPRAEPGRLGDPRRIDEIPEGEIMELNFHGLTALAAVRDDGSWLLLRGSEVRIETVPSATASASHLRAEWLSSGILEPAHDGSCYIVRRDIVFASGSAVSHFVTGSKGKSLASWRPIADAEATPRR